MTILLLSLSPGCVIIGSQLLTHLLEILADLVFIVQSKADALLRGAYPVHAESRYTVCARGLSCEDGGCRWKKPTTCPTMSTWREVKQTFAGRLTRGWLMRENVICDIGSWKIGRAHV